MLSLEPGRTPYDLHFRIFGIPARIHPGFWLVAFILGFNWDRNPLTVLIFMGVMFVSILIHELGHALLMSRFGYSPHIVLYHMGGLAIPNEGFYGGFQRPRRDTWSSILTLLAGPGAGFAFAGLTLLMIVVAGGSLHLAPPSIHNPLIFLLVTWPASLPETLQEVVTILFMLNIFWGLINLVPVLPLDGGQIARELFVYRDRHYGFLHAVQLSIGIGAVMAIFLWMGADQPYAAMMFGLLAISNYLTLQQLGRNW